MGTAAAFRSGPRLERPDGTELATWDLGGEGPALLLLHATGLHALCWLPVAAHLRGRFSCYALDLRGHGHSGIPPTGDFDWRTQAADVRAAAAAFELDRPAVVGHSGGGAMAILAEEQAPTWRALYCYEPILPDPSQPGDAGRALAAGARRRRAVFDSTAAAHANSAAKPPFMHFDPAALAAYVEHGFADLPDGRITLRCRGESEAATYEAAAEHRGFDHLDVVGAPVILGAGGADTHLDRAHLGEMASRLPHGRVEIFDALGHFGPLEDPAAVAASITRALIPEGDTPPR